MRIIVQLQRVHTIAVKKKRKVYALQLLKAQFEVFNRRIELEEKRNKIVETIYTIVKFLAIFMVVVPDTMRRGTRVYFQPRVE